MGAHKDDSVGGEGKSIENETKINPLFEVSKQLSVNKVETLGKATDEMYDCDSDEDEYATPGNTNTAKGSAYAAKPKFQERVVSGSGYNDDDIVDQELDGIASMHAHYFTHSANVSEMF